MKHLAHLLGILVFTTALAINTDAQSFLTNGLVAYYPFNGDAIDASGNGNDGLVQGATLTTDRFGVANRAFYFDGATSRIVIPETIFAATNAEWTVSVWVTPASSTSTNQEVILQKSGHNGSMTFEIKSGIVNFGPKLAASGGTWYLATSPITLNTTHHLVGVYKRGLQIELYLDGLLKDSQPVPPSDLFLDVAFPLVSAIGIYDFTPAPYDAFKGIIDDVRFYTRTLTPSEVQQLYNVEFGPKISLLKAVKPSFSELWPGTNYQLQVSSDMTNWTNEGLPFTATNSSMLYPQYWDVDNWSQLFFRLQVAP